MEETLKLALSLDLVAANFFIYTPWPGTSLFRELAEKGLIPPPRLSFLRRVREQSLRDQLAGTAEVPETLPGPFPSPPPHSGDAGGSPGAGFSGTTFSPPVSDVRSEKMVGVRKLKNILNKRCQIGIFVLHYSFLTAAPLQVVRPTRRRDQPGRMTARNAEKKEES